MTDYFGLPQFATLLVQEGVLSLSLRALSVRL